MRRQTKWVFAFLAVVFAGSFVFLGVGSGGSALTDFLSGNVHLFGSGGGPSEKSLEHKIAKDPTNAKLRLQLAQLYTKNNHLDQSIAEYNAYLKLKPTDTTALNELGDVYASKVQEFQSAVQSPPTPPLTAINGVSPIASNTTLGTAIATLTPVEFGQNSLQQGETVQLLKLLDQVIKQHVNVYLRLAKLTPGDSSAFLEAATTAEADKAYPLAIKLDRQFLAKFPGDPLVPDVKRNIRRLQNQLASGQTSSPTTSPTIPGATSPTG